jgi:hypothetical protein
MDGWMTGCSPAFFSSNVGNPHNPRDYVSPSNPRWGAHIARPSVSHGVFQLSPPSSGASWTPGQARQPLVTRLGHERIGEVHTHCQTAHQALLEGPLEGSWVSTPVQQLCGGIMEVGRVL